MNSHRFRRALWSSSPVYNDGMKKYKLFIDLDGVLADFDAKVEELTGKRPDRSNPKADKEMWKAIEKAKTFYRDLELMPDAQHLIGWLRTKLSNDWTILTGISQTPGCAEQKREWCAEVLGDDIPVITCASKDKAAEAWKVTPKGWTPVLVDDWVKYRDVWEQAGGVFILHTSAVDSIKQLKELGL